MTAPELIPLKQAGDTLTLNVMACQQVPVGRYPEVEFTGIDATRRLCAVRVPLSSATRQLGRIEQTTQTIVGKTVTFSRDPNQVDPSKPFWGITLSDASLPSAPVATPAPAAQAAVAQPTAPVGESENGAALYAKITDYALDKILPKYAAKGIPITMEGTAAIIATLYISASRKY